MNLYVLKIARDLQKEWAAYKVGGESSFHTRLSTSNGYEQLEFEIRISVRGKTKTCITWLRGSTPNEVALSLFQWIDKDKEKHNRYIINRISWDYSKGMLEHIAAGLLDPVTLECEAYLDEQ